ncbi:hypothetical protein YASMINEVIRUS_984 [Yasminevirus sp. GU-2018]|uniref:DNA mismatch repair proteins mutS family domain-containing protein n=1 Tax=Yasminevirus sp. GU-2018 TaxID=2420051 RepID=A0A5K0UA92_9VIRU|nr:hypothetical protein YASMINEVIRUS_984 [Yasminevirus sp. GU-2018]
MNHRVKLFHNKDAYRDLSIGSEMFQYIDRTVTAAGRKKLKHRLRYCSADQTYLENLALKNYTIHKDLVYRYDMGEHLQKIKLLEGEMDNWMIKDCDTSLIYSWGLANNRYLLSLSNKLKFSYMLMVLVIYVLVYLYLYYHGFRISPKEYVEGIVIGYYEFLKMMCTLVLTNRVWIERTTMVLATLYIGYQLYMMYQTVNTSYEHYNKCSSFYDSYQKIREYVEIVERMCDIEVYQDVDKVRESIEYLKYYFSESSSLGFSLVTKLRSENYVKHIDVLINFVGRVDCGLCVANLIDDGYTVPKFVKSSFPILHAEGIWSPMIPYGRRVKNSLTMNVTTPNVQIITGPNKAGKSTFMRSLVTAVYLAQSLGVSSADKLGLTPFRDIFTYLNVPDCIGRESLFEAELNRCYSYIEKTESLRGFSIGIVDELFTGTNPREGKAASYAILKRVVENPTNITILSTHFHEIIDVLESDKFKFSKFTATKKGDNFSYTYKMEDGVSDQCIALQLLKERGFDKSLVDDAINYIAYDVNKSLKDP